MIKRYLFAVLALMSLSAIAIDAKAPADSTYKRLSTEEFFKKMNKSFDVLGAVYKELAINYLVDVDPELLMEKAIDGMLDDLDPYTVYYPAGSENSSDMLEGEEYIGYGITITRIDSSIYIKRVKPGYGADEAGLKAGDKLVNIDGKDLYGLSSDSLSNYTRGEEGTSAMTTYERGGELFKTRVTRMNIEDPPLKHSEMLAGDVAYVALDRFSRKSSMELKQALRELGKSSKLNAVILDLRGNGGGLLEQAVKIVETFVPRGSVIVSTKGRFDAELMTYKALLDPEYPDIKVAVLVDGGSASASEVVTGAMQDLDRGVVLGSRSFGKGLVQTYASLPHGGKLKLTSANYYTPSGRSIQKLDIEQLVNGRTGFTDSLEVFTTVGGRVLPQHKGIMPDTVLSSFPLSNEFMSIVNPDYVFRYIVRHVKEPGKYGLNSTIEDEVIEDMVAKLDFDQIRYGYPDLRYMDYADDDIEGEIGSDVTYAIDNAKNMILDEVKKDLLTKKDELKTLLKIELMRWNLTNEEYIRYFLSKDQVAQEAINILSSERYADILTPQSEPAIEASTETNSPVLEKE